ncbi:MAG: VOC family protein [Planctomycetota bacterium]|nr:VOC family protein [Planctomycetaceae bacterium]MDQ3330789.1 VOC family protein [Planctomycetota bacterium]
MQVQSYLNFDGRCEEALEFYKRTLGATVSCLMRFSESPEPCDPNMVPPGNEHKVMHSSFKVGETELMASDCGCQGKATFQGVSLALSAPKVAEAERLFAALGEGGQVQMPMTKTFFSPRFGMVADKFGVSWMVLAEAE